MIPKAEDDEIETQKKFWSFLVVNLSPPNSSTDNWIVGGGRRDSRISYLFIQVVPNSLKSTQGLSIWAKTENWVKDTVYGILSLSIWVYS